MPRAARLVLGRLDAPRRETPRPARPRARLVWRRDCDGVTRGYLCDGRHDSGEVARRVA